MKTKDCPSCGLTVPKSASRCKECWHDFDTPETTGSWAGPIALLVSFAAMAFVGALVLGFIVMQPTEERILVDQDTRSVVWTTQYRTGIETQRLLWDDILKLEYVTQRTGTYAIKALTTKGDRMVIQEGPSPLRSEASQYAKLMEKELVVVDETTGFHTMDQ
jgi:hypothetical protein